MCSNIFGVRCGHSPRVYVGAEQIKAMIVGHSPSTRTKSIASTVLNIDKKNRCLYKYITNSILEPLGLSEREVYCTNLLKCFTQNMPEDAEKTSNGYMTNIFYNCISLLEQEIRVINPRVIIGLSETVLKLLSKRYTGKELQMKENFAAVQNFSINDKSFPFIPCVHLPKKNSKVESYYFPIQTQKLSLLKELFL